ncbi:MAG: NADPH-dependent F420 reductase [Candidatus Saccharibacteria bacterium]
MKVAIVGKGHAGRALGAGLEKVGHDVKYGHRDPNEPVDKAAEWGDIIIMAVPYSQLENAANEVGERADGKTVIDVTNPLGPNWELAVACKTSAAEELQQMLPDAKVVKAFNTVFAKNQSRGKIGDEPLAAFIAGDDDEAKRTVMDIAAEMGYEPIDCGSLKCSRELESMGKQIISLGLERGMGTDIGYRLVKG